MRLVEGKIIWVSRVNPSLIIRLYKSDAEGFQDEELADELGCAIIARIEDIFAATDSYGADDGSKKLKCPSCGEMMKVMFPERHDTHEKPMECICGYKTTLYEYRKSCQDKKLHGGGAIPAFEKFVSQYTAAKDYSGKMLAIDTLIHTFHGELQGKERFSRTAAHNIIYSRRNSDLVDLLNALAYSNNSTLGLLSNKERFLINLHK
jgi:hypothetical protein